MPSSGQREAAFKGGAVDFGLCHARIMFDFERRKGAAFVTAKPGKTYQRADIGASLRQPGGFGRRPGSFPSEPARQAAPPRLHPPVIGGKKAISRAFWIKASCLTWVRSSAVRIDLLCAKAALETTLPNRSRVTDAWKLACAARAADRRRRACAPPQRHRDP